MALTATQPMPVIQVITTSLTSPKLTFVLDTPYVGPFFLKTIIVTRTAVPTPNVMVPGASSTSGGKLYLYVDAATMTDLHALGNPPYNLVLSYDTVTSDVVQLDVIRDVASKSQDLVDALVIALQQIFPDSAKALLVEGEKRRRNHPSAE
jgi:hypothetical protein